MVGRYVHSFEISRSNAESCSTPQCCVLCGWTTSAWTCLGSGNNLDGKWDKLVLLSEGRGREEALGSSKESRVLLQHPESVQEPRKLLTPGFPAISYSSKNQQIIKIPLRWLKIKWKDKQTDCNSVSPPLCPLSAHNQSILGECQKGQVSSLSLLPLPWSFRIPFSALLELCSCALWLVRGIG